MGEKIERRLPNCTCTPQHTCQTSQHIPTHVLDESRLQAPVRGVTVTGTRLCVVNKITGKNREALAELHLVLGFRV